MGIQRQIPVLKFFGIGSAFSSRHTNAYYKVSKPNSKEKDLVIIDLSTTNLDKAIREAKRDNIANVYLVITHTHGDHVSGVGLFTQYLYYNQHKTLTVIAPTVILDDMATLFNIEGVDENAYKLECIASAPESLGICKAVPVEHTIQLADKTFGYLLTIKGKKVIYSGDLTSLDAFEEYLDAADEIYIGVSLSGGVSHISYWDVQDRLSELAKVKDIYLMHIDDTTKLSTMGVSDFHIAQIK